MTNGFGSLRPSTVVERVGMIEWDSVKQLPCEQESSRETEPAARDAALKACPEMWPGVFLFPSHNCSAGRRAFMRNFVPAESTERYLSSERKTVTWRSLSLCVAFSR